MMQLMGRRIREVKASLIREQRVSAKWRGGRRRRAGGNRKERGGLRKQDLKRIDWI